MAIFDDEDQATVKTIGLTGAGFGVLTVILIILALIVT